MPEESTNLGTLVKYGQMIFEAGGFCRPEI